MLDVSLIQFWALIGCRKSPATLYYPPGTLAQAVAGRVVNRWLKK